MRDKQSLSLKRVMVACMTAICFSGAMVPMVTGTAYAQDEANEGRQFSSKSGEKVLEAQNMMTANDYSGALVKLNEVLAIEGLNPYERSIVYQMRGSVNYELNQFTQAIDSFEKAIAAGGLNQKEKDQLRLNIAQLLIGNGQYARGAQMLEDFANRGGNLEPKHIEYLTQAWVQAENYTKALPWAQRWFNNANPKERKHYDLLNFLYSNLQMPAKQADIVKEMIGRWPDDKSLWGNWASLLSSGGRVEEAFEVNKMLYLGGFMTTSDDLLRVIQYYAFYDMPYQAAEILEREMNAGRIPESTERLNQLSDYFRQAREYERAIPILEKAAKQSNKAKPYADLGEALYNGGKCEQAEVAFTEAINRGYDAGKAWSQLGSCRYEDAQKEDRISCDGTTAAQRKNHIKNQKRNRAIEAFNKVPSTSREARNAKKWVSFIRAEAQAVEDRCDFIDSLAEELCFIKIKQAYDAQVFTATFELDEECNDYKAKYDRLYRPKVVVEAVE